MRVLFVADVVGKPGRAGLARAMPGLRERHAPDLVIVNGENSAGGLGITEKTADDLFSIGADVITLGNHAYRHRDAYGYLDRTERVVRPANFMASSPGRGHGDRRGRRVAGRRDQPDRRGPAARGALAVRRGRRAARAARRPRRRASSIDFHAEVTSEKVAMGWHLDGRAGAVLGTHTHVPTADARVLPRGTAFISDVGMTGSRASVLGVRWEQALEGFRTQMPVRFTTAEDDVWVNAVVVEIGPDGLARSIEQVLEPAPD